MCYPVCETMERDVSPWQSICSWCNRSLDQFFMVHTFFFHYSQCSTTGISKVVVCPILSVQWCILKIPCCYCSDDSGFPLSLSEWYFTICPMPYNCQNTMCCFLRAWIFLYWNILIIRIRYLWTCWLLMSANTLELLLVEAVISIKISNLLICFCSFDFKISSIYHLFIPLVHILSKLFDRHLKWGAGGGAWDYN